MGWEPILTPPLQAALLAGWVSHQDPASSSAAQNQQGLRCLDGPLLKIQEHIQNPPWYYDSKGTVWSCRLIHSEMVELLDVWSYFKSCLWADFASWWWKWNGPGSVYVITLYHTLGWGTLCAKLLSVTLAGACFGLLAISGKCGILHKKISI